jgi:hypothetical protein
VYYNINKGTGNKLKKESEDLNMTGAIKINGTYGAKIGNLQVFTYEGAVNAYKIFCELFNRDMTMEASAVMSDASLDMHRIGFTWDEIEAIELSVL